MKAHKKGLIEAMKKKKKRMLRGEVRFENARHYLGIKLINCPKKSLSSTIFISELNVYI